MKAPLVGVGLRQQHRPRPVAEEHAGRAILPVQDLENVSAPMTSTFR
jgi:hypothetical protein